eukprot:5767674-Amphidinium_carterae.1
MARICKTGCSTSEIGDTSSSCNRVVLLGGVVPRPHRQLVLLSCGLALQILIVCPLLPALNALQSRVLTSSELCSFCVLQAGGSMQSIVLLLPFP